VFLPNAGFEVFISAIDLSLHAEWNTLPAQLKVYDETGDFDPVKTATWLH